MIQWYQGRNRRGEPLMMLGLVLVGWIGARAMVLDGYAPGRDAPRTGTLGNLRGAPMTPATIPALAVPKEHVTGYDHAMRPAVPSRAALGDAAAWNGQLRRLATRPVRATRPNGARAPAPWPAEAAKCCAPVDAVDEPQPPMRAATSPSLPRLARWSGDGWVLLRGGGSAAALAAGASAYGGSQAGAVLRYRLAPQSAFRPVVYARMTSALGGVSVDRQLALGLSARAVPGLPVALMGEGRVQQSATATRMRPAIALVSELPPQRLPLGMEAEFYGQAGWVGGRDPTGFFDAQLTADRPLVDALPGTELRAGAGAWSGGQRGAARLDLGPRLALRTIVSGVPARLAFDWRFRVAGRALPSSGPTLTLAAGF